MAQTVHLQDLERRIEKVGTTLDQLRGYL